jgi:hypothetical protein
MNLRRKILCALVLAIVATGLLLAWHWRPARQVALHQQHLLQAVENRNWPKVSSFLADDYRDRWRQDKFHALANLRQALADFLALGVQERDPVVLEWSEGDAVVKARLQCVGSGGPISQFVMQRLEEFHEPFVFRWRHRSWMPWDWALIAVDQPELPSLPMEEEL